MAVSLNDIKTKIASTKNTSQITNAMQMVSAAKLGRSEEAARNFQVYAQKVRKLLTDILHGNGGVGASCVGAAAKHDGSELALSPRRRQCGLCHVEHHVSRKTASRKRFLCLKTPF